MTKIIKASNYPKEYKDLFINGFVVKNKLIKKIKRLYSHKREKGGFFLGRPFLSENIMLNMISLPHRKDISTRSKYVFSMQHDNTVSKAEDKYNLMKLGFWHTHPGTPEPSSADISFLIGNNIPFGMIFSNYQTSVFFRLKNKVYYHLKDERDDGYFYPQGYFKKINNEWELIGNK